LTYDLKPTTYHLILDKKYRSNTEGIRSFLSYDSLINEDYSPLFDLLGNYQNLISAKANVLIDTLTRIKSDRLNDFLSSMIHMLCNRLFKSMLETVLGLDVVNNETFSFDDIVGKSYKQRSSSLPRNPLKSS